ncbi:type I secretion protein [Sedimentitalea sp. CY04]|uniref:Type I secretion protein n=1 Tax=Parasedimentitalea denitrificans TaxID=2211118 RepID=A0ABX0W6G8_9RHOB|nr:type I secretion protein [Sedimentitalea sp. CY04]NIZ61253.1 type I secretion protein [Sedimentitalea sp. CY04]
MVALEIGSEIGNPISQNLFGGNFLFTRDRLGDEGTYDEVSAALGTENIRYPGGSITERLFDITDPDRSIAFDYEAEKFVEIVPISEFLAFAEQEGLTVTVVLPTRSFLSEETDINDNRFVEIDEQALSQFAIDVASGVYGNAKIDAFEIGNEYWGSGEMSSVEYGRVSSRMVEILDAALDSVSNADFPSDDIDLVVQSGTNFSHSQLDDQYSYTSDPDEILEALQADYGLDPEGDFKFSSGALNWTSINDEMITREFDTPEEIGGLDAVAAHVYSREPEVPGTRDFFLKQIDNSWLEKFPDLETYITEWNLKSGVGALGSSDYGLKQAHEMLNIIEAFSDHGVDAAHVWPLSQNTSNALSRGFEFEKLSAPGEMFRLMEEELTGTRPLDLIGSDGGETEISVSNIDVHAFASPEKYVMYLASTSDEVTNTTVDLSNLLSEDDSAYVTYLGVQPGDDPGGITSDAFIEEPSAREVQQEIFVNGIVKVDLDAHEIMQVVINSPTWSDDMENYWSNIGGDSSEPVDEPVIPETDPPNDDDAQKYDQVEVSDEGGDDGSGFSGILVALLPLLALFGLG